MYVGVIQEDLELEERSGTYEGQALIDPGVVLRRRLKLSDPRCDKLEEVLGFALENVGDHGSGRCKIVGGVDSLGRLVVEVIDEEGGFDPATIAIPSLNVMLSIGGSGYANYQTSEAKVGHSPNGKITYLIVD